MSDFPTVRPELRRLIIDGLSAPYMSESCQDATQTGNHYQSVLLGEERTQGFRTGREGFLDQIEFNGHTVLDLGSNLGELSRAARRRGATFVDGYEYDRYFIELANLINAYNGTTRVSFSARDITDPSVYTGSYDIVLAFAVFNYVGSVLDQLAEITDGVVVAETHALNDDLATYVDQLSVYFSHHVLLGLSDWGGSFPADVKRAVLVFAKDARMLETLVPGQYAEKDA